MEIILFPKQWRCLGAYTAYILQFWFTYRKGGMFCNENKADFQNHLWNTPAPYMKTRIDRGCRFVLKGLTAAFPVCQCWQQRCSWSCWQDRAPAPWQLLWRLQPRLSLQCVATAEPQRQQQSQRTPTKQETLPRPKNIANTGSHPGIQGAMHCIAASLHAYVPCVSE